MGLDPIRVDALDWIAHQFDVVAFERPEPMPVVDEHSLSRGWIIRHTLGQQLRIVPDHALHVGGQQCPQLIVGGAHRTLAIRIFAGIAVPFGIAPHHGQQAFAGGPEHEEPVPLAVERHLVQQPVLGLRDRRVVVGALRNPWRRALEHRDLRCFLGDLRHRLERAGTRADHDDALVLEIVLGFPLRGVERRPPEAVPTLDFGQLGPIELAHGADDRVGRQRGFAVWTPNLDPPGAWILVAGFKDFRGQPDIVPNAVLRGDPLEILEQHALRREMLRPVLGCERIGVGVVRGIDPAARVAVLEPCAADTGVLVHHGVADTGFL